MKKQRFQIDFFEFAFLVEACIPPAPIARTYFFHNVIDRYYFEMTPKERQHLFFWINRSSRFNPKEELCEIFNARFNPDNQYLVTTYIDGIVDQHKTFLYNGHYHTLHNTSIMEEYTTKIEKITP